MDCGEWIDNLSNSLLVQLRSKVWNINSAMPAISLGSQSRFRFSLFISIEEVIVIHIGVKT
jgi:hypothetical protein